MKRTLLTIGDYGKITIPQALGINHWYVIGGAAVFTILFFMVSEKKGL